MTKRLLLGAGLFSLSMFALACAGDPNKQANDAHDAELKAERKQVQATAEERSDTRVTAAEQQRAVVSNNASGSSASQNATEADAKMNESRNVYRAKATERLEKLDAKTSELRQLVDRAGGKATTASRDALKTVDTQRSLVTRELDGLPKLSNDAFAQGKTSLDTQLDNLEGLIKKAENEVSTFTK
jgi:hypothetical protein